MWISYSESPKLVCQGSIWKRYLLLVLVEVVELYEVEEVELYEVEVVELYEVEVEEGGKLYPRVGYFSWPAI